MKHYYAHYVKQLTRWEHFFHRVEQVLTGLPTAKRPTLLNCSILSYWYLFVNINLHLKKRTMIIIQDDLPFSRPAITGYFFSILLFAELIVTSGVQQW